MKLEKIDPKKAAVLVIDMQNDFIKPGSPLFSKMGFDMAGKMSAFLDECRKKGILVIYTQNTIRPDGKDMGKAGEFCPAIKSGQALVKGSEGAEIFETVAPKEDDIVVEKHRYSSFYGTDLEIILKGSKIDVVGIAGVCTECCCFSTARSAGFRGYDVAFLSDLTGTLDYPDIGFGAMTAEEMHRAMLTNIAVTTADVMTSDHFLSLVGNSKSSV